MICFSDDEMKKFKPLERGDAAPLRVAFQGYEGHQYPFKNGEMLTYLGELRNMMGHVVVANEKGKIFSGYHTEIFVVLGDDT